MPTLRWLAARAIALAFLLQLMVPAVLSAASNPFPADWFWGDANLRARHDSMIGKPMPELKLTDWRNGERTKEDLEGKIVILDFWATWCGPCIAALPKTNEMAEKYKDRGVEVIAICGSANGQERMDEKIAELKLTLPVARDSTQEIAKAYNVNFWPTYVAIGRDGRVAAVGIKSSQVENVLKAMLGESTPALLSGASPAAAGGSDPFAQFHEGSPARRAALASLTMAPAPQIRGANWMNGQAVTNEDLKGKIVVLDFWATWCAPCIASIPKNNELAEKWKDKGVVFIGVCHPQGAEKMAETAEKHGIRYPIVADPGGAMIADYKVDSFPDYYIIDREGRLVVADCQNGKVADAVERLLAMD